MGIFNLMIHGLTWMIH